MAASADAYSRLGLGCNSLGHIERPAADRLIGTALERGVTFFDTANVYADGRSEEELGRLLPRHREDVRVCTKFGHPASVPTGTAPCSPAAVISAVEGSLRRLRRERIDLCLIHFPDRATPLAATLSAIGALIAAGKIAHYGASNFASADLEALAQAAEAAGLPKPEIVQDEFNLISRAAETSLLPTARKLGIGFIPSFPLASGLLTGKFSSRSAPTESFRDKVVRGFAERFLHDCNVRKIEKLREFCAGHGISMTQVALQWLAVRADVTTIIAGASSADQLRANADELERSLRPELLEAASRLVEEA